MVMCLWPSNCQDILYSRQNTLTPLREEPQMTRTSAVKGKANEGQRHWQWTAEPLNTRLSRLLKGLWCSKYTMILFCKGSLMPFLGRRYSSHEFSITAALSGLGLLSQHLPDNALQITHHGILPVSID